MKRAWTIIALDYRTGIFVWIVIWLFYHFFTLGISPIPWYDEVFYADIADSLRETGKMFLRMSLRPEDAGQEILRYGPVYFYLQSTLINIFGLKAEVVRILNLLSGISLVFLFAWVTIKLKMDKMASFLIILFITTDTIFQSNMHSGRMDLFAALLFFTAFFLFIFKNKLCLTPLYGLLFAAAFLTTPRIGFYFIAVLFLFVYEILSEKKQAARTVIKYLILGSAFMLPLLLWIFLKFDGPAGYLSYLQGDPLLNAHMGFNIVPNKYQIPVLLVFLSLFIAVLVKRKPGVFDYLLFVLVVVHWCFVREVGPYSAMIMPVIYCSLLLSLNKLKPTGAMKRVTTGILLLVLILNISIFVIKAVLVIADREARSQNMAEKQLVKYDLRGKAVMADYKFYYLVKSLGADYISFPFNEEILNKDNLKKLDYILVNRNGLMTLKDKFPGTICNEIPIESLNQSDAYKFIRRFGYDIESNYNGFLLVLR